MVYNCRPAIFSCQNFKYAYVHVQSSRSRRVQWDLMRHRKAWWSASLHAENFLRLNALKCEVIVFGKDRQRHDAVLSTRDNVSLPFRTPDSSFCTATHYTVSGTVLLVKWSSKCLGYWWKTKLLATHSVEGNTGKAHRAFFHFGSIGTFQEISVHCLPCRSVIKAHVT